VFTALVCALLAAAEPERPRDLFTITVVDEETGRGVPLVELRTTNGLRSWTDSNGVVAFHEPGLMGQEVFFHFSSHGYEFPKDGFGFRGKALRVSPGGQAKLALKRLNLAERLYRVTGAGIYRDSFLAGIRTPIKEPVLNGLVTGSDSVLNAVYRDRLYWFWGDTNRPAYPLGNFQVPGAISELPAKGGLDPDAGIDLRYFVDHTGFAKPTAKMPGKEPTWMTTLVPLPDKKGFERLYASYVKVEPPLKVYARGLMVFDDEREEFEHAADVDMKAIAFPSGHAFRHREDGVEHVYFAHPFPLLRVRATAETFLNPAAYESYTCLRAGTRLEAGEVERDRDGRLVYGWKKDTPAVGPKEEAQLRAAGKLKQEELRWQLRDRESGKTVAPHSGSVYWNEYRRRWVMIAVQSGGTSMLGEVWYAEADTPVGPWLYAVKVVTHERYSFYNPKQHPMFDRDGGRRIYFEGTYTHTFSGNTDATPRYDYNQVLYKLDLGDPRVSLPVAVYDVSAGEVPEAFQARRPDQGTPRVAFFASDRALPGTRPVLADKDGLHLGREGDAGAIFFALRPDTQSPPAGTVPLYEFRHKSGRRAYSIDAKAALPGYERAEKPVCLVWSGR
jgi:hypothetical protein